MVIAGKTRPISGTYSDERTYVRNKNKEKRKQAIIDDCTAGLPACSNRLTNTLGKNSAPATCP
eukprot:CAMPEP_0198235634 /NCGR_PEP_ID=MMETSP1446-20131203/1516_1 /TAXON_ID=1461542 ORGANISM="Unidentified sp, Strain CCMP2111" /NCGR_SAMPLE_ID=MMETSP1446 /ASSEMBLY_ACC=CAM_ASM_001112 /LENGTH=62 /DNA_ID=CAMNT_0043916921 /DNA_START=1 /DNA_END=186 /DNA_ORIENTATION=+